MIDTVQAAIDTLAGHHVRSDQVQQVIFKELTLKADEPLFAQIDGEPYQSPGDIIIRVRRQTLGVLVPGPAPANLFQTPYIH